MSLQVIIAILVAAGSLAYFIPTPQELRNSFVSGQNYFAARNYVKAIEQYDKVLAVESDLLTADSVQVTLLNGDLTVGVRSAAIYQKANSYRTLGQYDSAIATFRVALTRHDSPKLLVLSRYQIYDLFFTKKQYDSAIVAARDLVLNHPFDEKVEQAYYDIGWAFRFLQQYDSSSKAFQHLVDAYKQSQFRVRAMYQIGQNALDAQQWTKAIDSYTTLVKEYKPESFSRADFQSMELKVNRERQIFDASSNREEDNTNLELVSKSEFKIAEAHEKLNEIEQAVSRYQYIIRTYILLPSLIEISYIRWSELMLRVKGVDAAVDIYRRAIDENFQNNIFQARMQYKIARTLQDEKEFDKSASEYEFYVKAYSEVSEQAEFSLENARFFAVLNYNAAKNLPRVITSSDSFLVNHTGSEFSSKAWILRGNAFLNLKQYAQARECYSTVIQSFANSVEAPHARMQYAKTYYDEKNYTSAIDRYGELTRTLSDPELNSEIQYYLGMSFFYSGKNDSAISALSMVKDFSHFYPFAFGRISKIYIAQNKYEDGERFIFGVLEQLPDTSQYKPYAHLTYGELLAATGKFDSAIAHMDIVIKDTTVVENARLQARYARGALFQQTKKFTEAVADLEYCLANQSFKENFTASIPAANEKLALSYLGLGKRKEAIDKITQLLNSSTSQLDRVRYLSALTEIYTQLNEYQKIIEFGTKVITADSADENSRVKAYAALSNAYGNINNLEKVVELLSDAITKLPKHPYIKEILLQTASLFYDGKAFQFAERLYGKFVEIYPEDAATEDALYRRSTSLIAIGKMDEGIALKRQLIQKYPDNSQNPQRQYEIAEAYYNAERFELAIQEYNRTSKDFPESELAVTAAYNKAWSYYRLGDTVRMVESFERFVKLHPNSVQAPDAQFSIADYYYNIKDYEKAKHAYQVILDKYKSYSRFEEAKSLVRELNQINSFLEYSKAMVFFDSQDYQRAIPMLQDVIKKYPDADVRYASEANIASAYEEMGDKKKALELFSAIIEKYSSVPEAQMIVFFAEQHKRWIESGGKNP